MVDTTLWLLVAAVIVNAVLVGATLDQSIKQLPARHRIGVVAYSEYSKAADLWHGIPWYAALGVGGALLTLITAAVGLTRRPDGTTTLALWLSIALTLAHSFTTARAAPTNFSQRNAAGDAARLTAIFDRFQRWQTARAILQVATLLAVAWALVSSLTD